eukprot:gene17112-biopygen10643
MDQPREFTRPGEAASRDEWYRSQDWWKDQHYVEDFWRDGEEGKKWTAKDEAAGIAGAGDSRPAKRWERKRRERWDAWRKDGEQWRAASEAEAKSGKPFEFVCSEEIARRDEWYRIQDLQWWQDQDYIEDFWRNSDKGKKWTAKDESAGIEDAGDIRPAPTWEKKRREQWFSS